MKKANDDLGLQTVARLHERLKIDEEWTQEEDRGFRWWPAEQAQEIWSEPAFDDQGVALWRLHIRTDVFRDFEATPEQLEFLEGPLVLSGTLSGPVREGETGDRLCLAASAWVHSKNAEWVTPLLAGVSLIQAAEARAWAIVAADRGVAPVATSAHPRSGLRTHPDTMVRLVEELVMSTGTQPSPWVGEEMERALELVNRPPCVLATGSSDGLTAEFPFLGDTSLLRVWPDAENPVVGRGLMVQLTVPVPVADMSECLDLNGREIQELVRAPFLGSWRPDEHGLAWVAFYPNSLFQEGLGWYVVISTAVRAKWVAECVYGDDWSESFEKAREAVLARTQALAEILETE